MRLLRVFLLIKNIIVFKAKNKKETARAFESNEVKHPAEFLIRW
jgi:hypothetical protein